MSSAPAFEAGLLLHRQGRLREAAQFYQANLKRDGKHVASLHYLGVIFVQQRQFACAIRLLRDAVSLDSGRAEAYNDLAVALAGLGRYDEAVPQYERALAINPRFAEAHNNLGLALAATRRLDQAITAFERAIAFKSDHPDAYNNLAHALTLLGRHEDAIAALHRALAAGAESAQMHNALGTAFAALNRHPQALIHYLKALAGLPDFAEPHNNLGNTLMALERRDEAVAHYRRALDIRPGFAQAHNNLGIALAGLKRFDEAMMHYHQALAIKPDLADAHNNLGIVLATLRRHDEAMAHYRKALTINPDFADAHGRLGNTLAALNCHEAAIESYERALAIAPDKVDVYANYANALRALGRLEESRRTLERAIELAPTRTDLYRSLAASTRFTVDDPHLAAMNALAAGLVSLSEDARVDLHFALGKAFADVGRHDDAFDHLLEGNTLKRGLISYDESETLLLFRRIAAAFTPMVMQRNPGRGHSSSVPVFIFGMPRSGTTLVEQILASHPKVFGAGELMEFRQAAIQIERQDGILPFPDSAASMTEQQFSRLGAHYVDRLRALAPTAERITDKGLANFCLAGLIHLALPNARMIHIRRDPVDTCLSCFSKLFGDDLPYSYDLVELGRYYRAYDALMTHWHSVLPDGVMIEVQYEELVTDFERQAHRLLAHCGLEWDDRCRAFYETQRPVQTASASEVRQPIYHSSIGRWRRYGHMLNPLLRELGVEWRGLPLDL